MANFFYQQAKPQGILAQYVDCFWVLQATDSFSGRQDRLIPDGNTELMLSFATPYKRSTADLHSHVELKSRSHLVGEREQPYLIEQLGETSYVSVRFKPGGLYPFLRIPMTELTNQAVDMELMWGTAVSDLESQVFEATTSEQKIGLLHQWLLNLLTKQPDTPQRPLAAALALIEANNGMCAVRDVADTVGLSQKQLERAFLRQVGLTPKLYARVVRFQSALRHLHTEKEEELAAVAACFGYTDQSHFTKEFREFTAATPTEFFAEKNLIAQMLTTGQVDV